MLIEDSYPLAPLQLGMLLYSLSSPRSGIYIQNCVCTLREELNCSALKLAWQEVAGCHPVLRTSFSILNRDRPLQEIWGDVSIPWEEYDWCGKSSRDQSSGLEAFLEEDRARGFDLNRAPLMRITLFRMAEADFRVVWTYHHALLDGRSRALVLQDVFRRYELIRAGLERPETPPPPYRIFVNWLETQDWTQAEEFWKEKLDHCNPSTSLGIERFTQNGGGEPSFGRQEVRLSGELTATLKSACQHQQFTLNNMLQGAWALLLSRYSGEDDIIFGATRSGRHSTVAGADSMVGLFINTVPVRIQVNANECLLPWLTEIRNQWVAMRPYEHTSLVDIQKSAKLPPGRPLFESLLVVENDEMSSTLRAQGGQWKNRDFRDISTPNYPLALSAYLGNQILIKIVYDQNRFDAESIGRMLGHFQTLLQNMAKNPSQRLSALPMLTPAEKHQVLGEWNGTKRNYPSGQCVHELFEAQAEQSPDAVALAFEDQQLTYRSLNVRANQLAHYLRKRGVRPESLVTICMERSVELVIAILAVLKTGGAYLPIDPDTPLQRLTLMLQDAQSPLILTQERFGSLLAECAAKSICLDTAWDYLSLESKDNVENQVCDTHAAYVIYTSGSTGTPKGVVNVHGGLRNRLQWMQETYRLTPADRVLQKTPFTFDVSVWEFLWPLIIGARLVLARPGGQRDSTYLVELIQSQQITTLHFVPPMLAAFLQEEGVESCRTLRQVFCSGEALPHDLQRQFFERSGAALHNLYGPTEASIDVTAWECRRESDVPIVPIGRPIANTRIYILDRYCLPVPIGVAGELHIGGEGLARGYLNRPELTAEKFIPDPFAANSARRLYKTGDFGRYLPDGNIEFLGRGDHQVKIRGFRIELGEIEAVLGQHRMVQSSVVAVREDEPGERRLVAYVVARPGESFDAAELRKHLKQKIPDYMIPAAWVLLDQLPLTPSGKVDPKALPAPDQNRPEWADVYKPPLTPTERALAAIWRELLKLDQVGIADNFFELGGHSLLATQLVSRIRNAFKLELSLRSLFEAPTIADLAEQIALARAGEARKKSLPISAEANEGEIPLSYSQERFWFLEQLTPNNPAYKVVYGFRLTGAVDVGALENALAEIVRRHEILRTTFHESRGTPVQRVSEQWCFRLNVIDGTEALRAEPDTNVQKLFESELGRRFDLSTDLLLRGVLVRLGESEQLLLISSHHIAWDHWSEEVFFSELSILYQAFTTAKPSSLSDLPIQYKHYAQWQRKEFQSSVYADCLAYWKEQLAGVPISSNLPTDHPRRALDRRRGGRVNLVLPREISGALGSLSNEAGVTLFMTFLAAFQTLLLRITGEADIVVGTPVAGRDRSETEGLIGVFLNSLPLRTNLSGNPTFLELLARVRDAALAAYEHQELPFEKLVAELQPERDLSRTPIFQVFINQYNFMEARLDLTGLSVTRFRAGAPAPQFDLSLSIREDDDGTHLTFVYDADLFEASTIRRMLGHFRNVLEAMVVNPRQGIGEFPLLSEAEKHQLLVEWNNTEKAYPRDKCFPQLFEAQVERTPEAIAAIFDNQQLTYRELNNRANQLAHYLQKLGIGPELRVGIHVERSMEMIVGLLGILKAGGAYVPLDPAHPKDRLGFVLEDAQVRLLLTQNKFAAEAIPAQLVCLDKDWPEVARASRLNPESGARPGSLAYVIYTSGSTGKPKGVMIEHGCLVNYLCWFNESPLTKAAQRLPVVTSPTFDASLKQLFAPLLRGAPVWILSDEVVSQPAGLLDALTRQSRVGLNCAPSLWKAMLDELNSDRARAVSASLSALFLGGEPLDQDLTDRTFATMPDIEIWNLYGPTEATANVCAGMVRRDSALTIGRPIANTQLYILDDNLQPVPIGVRGQLYVGGDGLARGYWNRPELTEETFIDHSFNGEPAKRLYKTGDWGRYLPDGSIEFLGRVDSQVKIRGFRIELGEIEAVLGHHPGIREAVVVVREDNPGDKRLIAYVVSLQAQTPTVNELRSYLKEKLPDYMVPSAFVFMDSLPLTANGKIDRRALPLPELTHRGDFVAPRTPVEKKIAEIWSDVLGVDKVAIDDNFF
ncbi:MAG: amino acid adenylation domain-containing protein, partial [Chloroflexota bacterium]